MSDVFDDLARLVDRGVVVAAASRYMPGGQQVGGPRFKRIASRWAGKTLKHFARVGTRDATNSFKAYDTDFVREVGIESNTGFEIGIELTAKATRMRRPVAEIPTIWLDRQLAADLHALHHSRHHCSPGITGHGAVDRVCRALCSYTCSREP